MTPLVVYLGIASEKRTHLGILHGRTIRRSFQHHRQCTNKVIPIAITFRMEDRAWSYKDLLSQRAPDGGGVLFCVIQGLCRVSGIGVVKLAVEQYILVILVDVDLSEASVHSGWR